jgi:lysophospholipase L1-like esterase
MSRIRRWRVLFAALPLCFVVAGIEAAVSVYRLYRCPGAAPTFAVPNAVYGWTHPPGATVHAYACLGPEYEWSTTATFNSKGLNDDEVTTGRVAGQPRILVLGDSVTEALQVAREEGFTERLETMLDPGAEVINAGHSGFGTDNELLYFESEGASYQADVVVLAFNLQNDVAENSSTIVRSMYAGGPVHPKADVRVNAGGGVQIDTTPYRRALDDWQADPWRSSPLLQWLRQRSFFVRQIVAVLKAGAATPVAAPADYPAELGVYAVPVTPEWAEARRATEALVQRLKFKVEVNRAQLLVLVIPSRETVTPADWSKMEAWFPALAHGQWDLEAPRRWLVAFLRDNRIDFVDATDTFRRRQAETGRPGFFSLDPHPDADGQRWLAEAIYPALEWRLLNPERRGSSID